ncbi:uncharacterized protein LOC124639668 [Helicoverpa zea]|uniref:uncharacterized protein LOC124639668 n=1 Tax=Helicoverpa zea TaxID=7113 RepID=UPI000B37238A|nr:uncharacterized protein LOC124639668 [Helicoverpa zea]
MDSQITLSKLEELFARQTTLITKNVTEDVTEKVTKNLSANIDGKLKPLIEENMKLRKEVTVLTTKLQKMEREIRNNNIILYGVKETENNSNELLGLIIQTLNAACEKTDLEKWDKWEINNFYRLGKPIENKTRPILITVTLAWRKAEMLKNKKYLPENVYINEDFPKEILKKRQELKKQQQEEINKGKLAYIRYDKLIIKEKPSEKRKRSPTNSPKTTEHPDEQITPAPPIKINKINKLEQVHRARSSSLSSNGPSKQ